MLFRSGEFIYASRNKFGAGQVVWLPSMVSLGAWRTRQSGPLASFLMREISCDGVGLRLKKQYKNVLMQTMRSGEKFITLFINKNQNTATIELSTPVNIATSKIIFADKGGKVTGRSVRIHPEETMVVVWK